MTAAETPEARQFLRDLDKKLWSAADRLRSKLAAAVYKHAVLGLIFLEYISDSFALRQREIEAQLRDPTSEYFLNPSAYGSEGQYAEAKDHLDMESANSFTSEHISAVRREHE